MPPEPSYLVGGYGALENTIDNLDNLYPRSWVWHFAETFETDRNQSPSRRPNTASAAYRPHPPANRQGLHQPDPGSRTVHPPEPSCTLTTHSPDDAPRIMPNVVVNVVRTAWKTTEATKPPAEVVTKVFVGREEMLVVPAHTGWPATQPPSESLKEATPETSQMEAFAGREGT